MLQHSRRGRRASVSLPSPPRHAAAAAPEDQDPRLCGAQWNPSRVFRVNPTMNLQQSINVSPRSLQGSPCSASAVHTVGDSGNRHLFI